MEFNYDASSKMYKGYPEIQKLGVVSMNGEASPFVWNGVAMRLELEDPTHGVDPNQISHAIIRERESGKILSRFGEGCYYYSLYVEDGTAYVLGTKSDKPYLSGSTIMIYESKNLINWTCRELLSRPGWKYFNTSLTKGPDGYVLLMEAGEPVDAVGVPFTLFFATSSDLVNWTFMDNDCCLSKERYNGGPWMRYSKGWYYIISVTALPLARYTNYIFRTKNFKDYEVGKYNPVLMPDNRDKIIAPHAHGLTEANIEEIKTGFNINNSDIDMCDYEGKTLLVYNLGNQLGFYCLCEAIYDGPVDQFLAHYFDE